MLQNFHGCMWLTAKLSHSKGCPHFVSSFSSLGTGHGLNFSCSPKVNLHAALPATRPKTTQSNKLLPPKPGSVEKGGNLGVFVQWNLQPINDELFGVLGFRVSKVNNLFSIHLRNGCFHGCHLLLHPLHTNQE